MSAGRDTDELNGGRRLRGREGVEQKGRRYLIEGRLAITFLHNRRIRAVCRGSAPAPYKLGFDLGDGWWCRCPARNDCAHLVALRLVTVAP